jgi:hypothetical protein
MITLICSAEHTSGKHNPPLSSNGSEECGNIEGSYDIVILSPLKRAIQTYANSNIKSKKVLLMDAVREFRHSGSKENLLDFEELYYENFGDFIARISTLKEFLKECEPASVAVITHKEFIWHYLHTYGHDIHLNHREHMTIDLETGTSIDSPLGDSSKRIDVSDYISEWYFINLSDFVHSLHSTDPANMFEDCTIYLFGNFIHSFIANVLPKIQVRFRLISGITDFTTPYGNDVGNNEKYDGRAILNNPFLISWHSPNNTHTHTKLHHLPLGAPRHIPEIMPGNPNSYPDHRFVTTGQHAYNRLPGTILSRMCAKRESDKLLYIGYTTDKSDKANIAKNVGFRRKLDEYIETTSFHKSELKPWIEYLEVMGQYKFTLEPHGRCLDGYRLWEAIYVGTIPIVFRSTISELHEDLPILIIDSFEDINPVNLEAQFETIINKRIHWNRLTASFWKYQILKIVSSNCDLDEQPVPIIPVKMLQQPPENYSSGSGNFFGNPKTIFKNLKVL